MRELSLFSGAGGGLLGSMLLGWRPVGYVEFNEYCQRVIAQRIADGIFPAAPIFGDIRTFLSEGYAASYTGMVDVISGGFPCQPFSVAGKRAGADDERNMWPSTIATIREVRPRYCFLENVPGLVSSGYFGTVLGDLAESGYDCRWRILSAAELGAPHNRNRLWIVAYSKHDGQLAAEVTRSIAQGINGDTSREEATIELEGCSKQCKDVAYAESRRAWRLPVRRGRPFEASADTNGGSEVIPNTDSGGVKEGRLSERTPPSQSRAGINGEDGGSHRPTWWEAEPDVGRVAYGVAARVDRIRAIGNGQVPAVAATAWRLLTEGL